MNRFNVWRQFVSTLFRPLYFRKFLHPIYDGINEEDNPLVLQVSVFAQPGVVVEYIWRFALTAIAWVWTWTIGVCLVRHIIVDVPGTYFASLDGPDWQLALPFLLGWTTMLGARAHGSEARWRGHRVLGGWVPATTGTALWLIAVMFRASLVDSEQRPSLAKYLVTHPLDLLDLSWPFLVGVCVATVGSYIPRHRGGVLGLGAMGILCGTAFANPGDVPGYLVTGSSFGMASGLAVSGRPELRAPAIVVAGWLTTIAAIGILGEPIAASLASGGVFGVAVASLSIPDGRKGSWPSLLIGGLGSALVTSAFYIAVPETTVLFGTALGFAVALRLWRMAADRTVTAAPRPRFALADVAAIAVNATAGIACAFTLDESGETFGGFGVLRQGQNIVTIGTYLVIPFALTFLFAATRMPQWMVLSAITSYDLARTRLFGSPRPVRLPRNLDEIVYLPVPFEAQALRLRWAAASDAVASYTKTWMRHAVELELVSVQGVIRRLVWKTLLGRAGAAESSQELATSLHELLELRALLPIHPEIDGVVKQIEEMRLASPDHIKRDFREATQWIRRLQAEHASASRADVKRLLAHIIHVLQRGPGDEVTGEELQEGDRKGSVLTPHSVAADGRRPETSRVPRDRTPLLPPHEPPTDLNLTPRPTTTRVFISYVRLKDEFGHVEEFRKRLAIELGLRLDGRPEDIFLDTQSIAPGEAWEERLESAVAQAEAMVVLLSPAFFDREWCRREVLAFTDRMAKEGLSDRLFPVRWINEANNHDDVVRARVAAHNPVDWTDLRFKPWTDEQKQRAISQLAEAIAAVVSHAPRSERRV